MKKKLIAVLYFLFSCSMVLNAATVSSLFSDNMVLQQGKKIPVWGKGKPGEIVEAEFNNKIKSATVDENSKWEIIFNSMDYGGPYTLKINSEGNSVEFKNVMIGEVWLCSGQSNMNMPLGRWGRINNYKAEIANALYDSIRLLTIPLTVETKPKDEVDTKGWQICSPENIESFSAVAYFFGRELYKKLNVPVGLIHVSKGGTPVESWMSKESLEEFPEFNDKILSVEELGTEALKKIYSDYKTDYKNWLEKLYEIDPGINEKWNKQVDLSDWSKMEIPVVWEKGGLGEFDGIVWFKKKITLPQQWLNQDLTLSLGPIQDLDITFFNGTKVGTQTKRDYMSVYNIDSSLVNKTDCEISVLILDNYGIGGIWGKPEEIYLQNEKGERISLCGEWYYKPSLDITKDDLAPPVNPRIERNPAVLFNGMISPLIGYAIKGFLWYQGESNSSRAYQYRKLFPVMINSWRDYWKDDELPFYFVQLAAYRAKHEKPVDDAWAELRESQALALQLDNTGMAVTTDIGNEVNVHPKNKQEVGRRLALIVLNKNYDRDVEFSGPVYKDHKVSDGKIIITFDHAEGLQTNDGKNPTGFAICGEDHEYHWASTKIEGSKVIVWSDEVEEPENVRYAWASNPDVNLYNDAGLPAIPFRTDDFTLSTENKK